MRAFGLSVLCMVNVLGCGPPFHDYDPTTNRFTGVEAKEHIEHWTRGKASLPASADNVYIFDGGTFNGSILYVSFDCGCREDCWAAVASLGGPDPSKFQPWAESNYAVVMDGPGCYFNQLRADPWNLRSIKSGVVHERVEGGDRRMDYYAIDFDRNRVYYHKESGGFSPRAYRSKVRSG